MGIRPCVCCLAAFLLVTAGLEEVAPGQSVEHGDVEGGGLGYRYRYRYRWPEHTAEGTNSRQTNVGEDGGKGLPSRERRKRKLPGWDWFPDVFSKGSKEDPTPVEPVEPAEPVEPGDGGNASPEREGIPGVTDTLRAQAQEQESARHRELLNSLVTASVDKTDRQACNVAFFKTHKTASTSLAMILVRYAKRHSKKLASFEGQYLSHIPLPRAVEQIRESGRRVDVMHYHVTEGEWKGTWEEALEMYEEIMQENERINYVTVVRSPREHFLSYYYYYLQPTNKMSIEQYLERARNKVMNPMCLEFGVTDHVQLEAFIEYHLPRFFLVILTEDFDRGLMVLRRRMRWEMIDMTYTKMMETKKGAMRWDDEPLVNVPSFESLPQWVQDTIDVNTALDKRLYEAAKEIFQQKVAEVGDIDIDLLEFRELQRIISAYLDGNTSSDARRWYASDAQPYKGGPPFYPF